MRKRYLHNDYGKNEQFWETNWDRNWEEKYIGNAAVDPILIHYVSRYLGKDMVLLEGGCGDGQYIKYFCDHGYKVMGIDYAEQTVRKVKRLLPHLDVRLGDVLALDFPDDYFDAYYSGGVIEHFEQGVTKALSEAHRVLKNGGLLFLTVPYMNLTRKLTALFVHDSYKVDLDGRRTYFRENVTAFTEDTAPPNYHFHEYFFSTKEMHSLLGRHHFEIIEEGPFSSTHGLLDLTLFRYLQGSDRQNRSTLNRMFSLPIYVLRYVEARCNLAIFGLICTMVGHLLGNLKLYVCKAVK